MKDRLKNGSKKAKRGIVYIVTSDDVLQAVMYSALTAFFFSVNEGIAVYVSRWLTDYFVFVPAKLIAAFGTVLLFAVAYSLKMNTDEWRETVRDATGEDEAVDRAEQESDN